MPNILKFISSRQYFRKQVLC